MSASKKIDLLRDFAAGVFLSEAQNSIPRPPYTQVYFFTQGKGEGGECWIREKGRGATGESTDLKAGLKISTWLKVRKKLAISVHCMNPDKTCRKVPFQVNFLDDFYDSYLSTVGKVHPQNFCFSLQRFSSILLVECLVLNFLQKMVSLASVANQLVWYTLKSFQFWTTDWMLVWPNLVWYLLL